MQYELGVVAHRLPLSGVGVLAPSGLTYRNMPVEGVGLRSSLDVLLDLPWVWLPANSLSSCARGIGVAWRQMRTGRVGKGRWELRRRPTLTRMKNCWRRMRMSCCSKSSMTRNHLSYRKSWRKNLTNCWYLRPGRRRCCWSLQRRNSRPPRCKCRRSWRSWRLRCSSAGWRRSQ